MTQPPALTPVEQIRERHAADDAFKAGDFGAYMLHAGAQTHDDRASLLAHIDRLSAALSMCAQQFRLYEKLHRAKPDNLKADTNMGFALMCEEALASIGHQPKREGDSPADRLAQESAQ